MTTETNQIMNPFKDSSKIKVLLCQPSAGNVDCIAADNRMDQYIEFGRLESRHALRYWDFAKSLFGGIISLSKFLHPLITLSGLWEEFKLCRDMPHFAFFTGNTGRTGINYAREAMATEAMKLGMDYLFMIDDDMIAPRRCFERVYETLVKEGADIAAPICTQRVAPFKPVMYKHRWIQGDQGERLSNDMIEDYEPNSVVRVDGIGFGVVLISVPFLVKLKEKMPRGMFFSNSDIGEDIWFCIKARKDLDAKIVVDTSVKVGHIRHPEIATEWDYVKATGRQEKFSGVYRPDGSFVCNNAIDLNAPGVKELSAVAA